MNFLKPIAAVSVVAALGALALQVRAGGEKVVFPEGFEKSVLYGTVDRHDVKRVHELFSTKAAVDAVRKGQPIPSGTVLINVQYHAKLDENSVPLKGPDGRFVKGSLFGYGVMEKRTGWGAEYPADFRNGEWEYQSFTAEKKENVQANLKACFQCHKPHEKQDFVMSLAALSGTALPKSIARPTAPRTVSISDFLFGPEKTSVQAGQTITWTNIDESPHQVTVQGASTMRTPVILKGQSTSVQFNDVGAYDYICGLHPNMKGKLEVTK